ncbi:hypothetical protein HFO97_25520 [Rhizobium leguminosarum]|nr:hypothetical protein [Rhizobium leguminosarum]MBY5363246.1 hypothetical protein [Rhizobium leguminosarum]
MQVADRKLLDITLEELFAFLLGVQLSDASWLATELSSGSDESLGGF